MRLGFPVQPSKKVEKGSPIKEGQKKVRSFGRWDRDVVEN